MKINFLKWYDALGFIIHAAVIAYAINSEILPSLGVSHATAAVIWIIWLTFSWTLYLFYRFQLHKKNFRKIRDGFESRLRRAYLRNTRYQSDLESLKRQSRYALIFEKLNFGFTKIHNVMRDSKIYDLLSLDVKAIKDFKDAGKTFEELTLKLTIVKKDLQNLCNEVADTFNIITGSSNCSVCIKIFRSEDPNEKMGCSVYTLIRDKDGEMNRNHAKEKKVTHWVKSNTAYSQVLGNLDLLNNRCFFENEIPLLKEYNNTSFQIYGYPKITCTTIAASKEQIIEAWTLPYFSTIVAPLCPLHSDELATNEIRGYLCIDSESMNTFNKKFDQPLTLGIADGIFNTVKLCVNLIDKGIEIEKHKNELELLNSKA